MMTAWIEIVGRVMIGCAILWELGRLGYLTRGAWKRWM